MNERPTRLDRAIGAAIRAARFSCGLTQHDLAAHLGVTRATVASYETGRRKIPAETLIRIARLCGKPLSFFAPSAHAPSAEITAASQAVSAAPPAEAQALQTITNVLRLRPDAIPLVLEFLEDWLSDQAAHASPEPRAGRDEE